MKNLWSYTKGFSHGVIAVCLYGGFHMVRDMRRELKELQEAKKAMTDPESPDYIFQDPSMR